MAASAAFLLLHIGAKQRVIGYCDKGKMQRHGAAGATGGSQRGAAGYVGTIGQRCKAAKAARAELGSEAACRALRRSPFVDVLLRSDARPRARVPEVARPAVAGCDQHLVVGAKLDAAAIRMMRIRQGGSMFFIFPYTEAADANAMGLIAGTTREMRVRSAAHQFDAANEYSSVRLY